MQVQEEFDMTFERNLNQVKNKPTKLARVMKFNAPQKRKYGKNVNKCRHCGKTRGIIGKYGLLNCRQCFREIAKQLGFKKFRWVNETWCIIRCAICNKKCRSCWKETYDCSSFKASQRGFDDIPEEQFAIFTGYVKPEKRAELWKSAKIIFSTPQGLENDIITSRINLEDVSLLCLSLASLSPST